VISRGFKEADRRTIRITKRFGWWKKHAVKAISSDVAEVLVDVLGVAEYADPNSGADSAAATTEKPN
jgi:hypothetical protein